MEKKKLKIQEHSHLTKYKFIGIDAGKSGGIASLSEEINEVYKCPDSIEEMAHLFARIINDTPPHHLIVMIEKVWARPHDGRSSIFKFAQNYGQWEGIVASHNIELNYVTPQVWMNAVECPKKLSKKDRKNFLKSLAKFKYPKLEKKIILKTADALLVAHYAREITISGIL